MWLQSCQKSPPNSTLFLPFQYRQTDRPTRQNDAFQVILKMNCRQYEGQCPEAKRVLLPPPPNFSRKKRHKLNKSHVPAKLNVFGLPFSRYLATDNLLLGASGSRIRLSSVPSGSISLLDACYIDNSLSSAENLNSRADEQCVPSLPLNWKLV